MALNKNGAFPNAKQTHIFVTSHCTDKAVRPTWVHPQLELAPGPWVIAESRRAGHSSRSCAKLVLISELFLCDI